MATPTEQVTRNAQDFLGDQHDVVLATRVEWGRDATTVAKQEGYLWGPYFFPVRVWRSIRAGLNGRRDDDAGVGILAHVEAGTVRSPKLEAELDRLRAVLGRSPYS